MVPKFLKVSKLARFGKSSGRPSREVVKRTTLAGLMAAALITAFYWGRHGGLDEARGQSPQQRLDPNLFKVSAADRGRYVVAYIFGDVPITREELGEYLIERVGAERVEFLVNRKIIDKVCADKNIRISDTEVNAQLADELALLKCNESQFVNNFLKRYNKTMVEYREDVIKPKLALRRYVQDTIVVTEKDILKGFEAKFGPRVECRIIALSKDHEKDKYSIWQQASKGLAEFEAEAKRINPGPLAAEAGKVPAIHKHFPDVNIEEQAFKLKPGEVSPLTGLPDGTTVILHCVRHIPSDTTVNLDKERMALHKEIFDQRVEERVKQIFPEMRKAANPQIFLKRDGVPTDAVTLTNHTTLNNQAPPMPQMPALPPMVPGAMSPPQSVVPPHAIMPPPPGANPILPPIVPPPGGKGGM